jgi:hypothetical protein
MFGIVNEFDIQTSSRIGRRGNKKNTGISMAIDKMLEINVMMGKEKATIAITGVKENTNVKTIKYF